VKVKQIKAIELANGRIQVQLEEGGYSDTLIIEVKDDRHYIRASTYDNEEIRNLFYFIKPTVVNNLKVKKKRLSEDLEHNQKELEEAKERESKGFLGLAEIYDDEFYNGKASLRIRLAEITREIVWLEDFE